MVCSSILANAQKRDLDDRDTHNEFHDAEELIFAEWVLVAHVLEMKVIFMQLLADLPVLTIYIAKFQWMRFWGSKMLPCT